MNSWPPILEVEQLIDHHPVRHVLKSVWTGFVEASVDGDEVSRSFAADEWEQDLSWLGELNLANFRRGHTDSHVYVEITYRAQITEVALGFQVKPTDAGWVITGPAGPSVPPGPTPAS
ncbi:hypothetical protein [Streptomyces sp. NPDC059575]|uniref:hypothetical protein n=1 Tax=Streptomyces sp. NPDC059575 TaxID=3346872 RepID=UPI00369DCEF2